MSNLRLINETTTTAGVQTVNITDVFSSDFDIYKIVGAVNLANNSTATGFNLRLINSSGTVISSGYEYAQLALKGETSFNENRGGSETRFWNVFGALDDSGQSAGNVAYVFNPFSSSSYTFCLWSSSSKPSGNYRMYKGIGNLYQLSSITGFQAELNESAGEFASGGKIRTYGLRVDS
tara:strand:+ start:2011 stop:2544 length:534 start_codon:yes stop_codon:yes gene_type:complete